MPLYGFLQGDTIGLLILAEESETIASLAEKLQVSAEIRVARRADPRVIFQDRVLDPKITVSRAGLGPLDRFDVRFDVRADVSSDLRAGERS